MFLYLYLSICKQILERKVVVVFFLDSFTCGNLCFLQLLCFFFLPVVYGLLATVLAIVVGVQLCCITFTFFARQQKPAISSPTSWLKKKWEQLGFYATT